MCIRDRFCNEAQAIDMRAGWPEPDLLQVLAVFEGEGLNAEDLKIFILLSEGEKA